MRDLPQPGIEPVPPALGAWSLNQWTAREVQNYSLLLIRRTILPSPTNYDSLVEQARMSLLLKGQNACSFLPQKKLRIN